MRRLEDVMIQLAEAQRRTEERVEQLAQRMDQLIVRVDQLTVRVDQLTVRVDQLTVRVDQLAQRMDQLTVRVDQLAQRMDQLTVRVDQLAQRMDQLTTQVERLVEVQLRMGTDLERLKGSDLERRYRERGHAYFRPLILRAHVLSGDELNALLDQAIAGGQLSERQADEIYEADVIVRGRRREDGVEVYLVVEVSWGVGISDVQRASERAALLARTGTPVIPVVAGFWISHEAEEPARAWRVWQMTDGRVISPEAAQ